MRLEFVLRTNNQMRGIIILKTMKIELLAVTGHGIRHLETARNLLNFGRRIVHGLNTLFYIL